MELQRNLFPVDLSSPVGQMSSDRIGTSEILVGRKQKNNGNIFELYCFHVVTSIIFAGNYGRRIKKSNTH